MVTSLSTSARVIFPTPLKLSGNVINTMSAEFFKVTPPLPKVFGGLNVAVTGPTVSRTAGLLRLGFWPVI